MIWSRTCSDLICSSDEAWSFVLTMGRHALTVVDNLLEADFKTGSTIEIISQIEPLRCPDPARRLRRVRPKALFLVIPFVSGLMRLGPTGLAFFRDARD